MSGFKSKSRFIEQKPLMANRTSLRSQYRNTMLSGLDRADREIYYVFDLHGFFLQEGFAVFDTD